MVAAAAAAAAGGGGGAAGAAKTLGSLANTGVSTSKYLFGTEVNTSGNSDTIAELLSKFSEQGLTTEYTDLSPEAIDRIISQILGSTEGLSSIFNKENSAGLFNSSVSAQAAGDLTAQLAGEIARLTAPKITSTAKDSTTQQDTSTKVTTKSVKKEEGAIKKLGGKIDARAAELKGKKNQFTNWLSGG